MTNRKNLGHHHPKFTKLQFNGALGELGEDPLQRHVDGLITNCRLAYLWLQFKG
jgi:hypothetical protein